MWEHYVSALDRHTATVFGVFLKRPAWMTSHDWERLWRGVGPREDIEVDPWKAKPFGAVIERPQGVTIKEWGDFWSPRIRGWVIR